MLAGLVVVVLAATCKGEGCVALPGRAGVWVASAALVVLQAHRLLGRGGMDPLPALGGAWLAAGGTLALALAAGRFLVGDTGAGMALALGGLAFWGLLSAHAQGAGAPPVLMVPVLGFLALVAAAVFWMLWSPIGAARVPVALGLVFAALVLPRVPWGRILPGRRLSKP